MQVSERLKKEAQTERQKLKEMSFRDKLWYIWEYYKFHILGVLIFLGILWVIGTSIYRSTYESELYCMYINNRSEQELNTDILTVDFHDFMEFTDKQLVNTESSFISYGDDTSEYSYASMAKISALVASNELDVMLRDEENFLHYACLLYTSCFFKVGVPLIMPTLLAAALLVFMRSFADFGTPMLIGEGYRTFPVVLYTEFINEVGGNDGFAAAIAVIAIVVTTVVFLAQKYVSNRNSFSLNALHPMEEKEAKGPVKILVHLAAYVIVGIAILPQVYVTYTSFKNTEGKIFVSGYSLSSYASAFGKLGRSIQNTLIIPICALVIIVLLAVLIAYLVVRRKNALTNTVDIISMIPYIVPGTVLGIALLTGFNKRPILLSGTMLIMVVALVIRRLPYTIRSSVAILQQIPMSIEEAAISLGASKMKSFFKVTVPMMTSGIVAGAILSWVTMISELSTAIILYTGRTKTLTVSVYTEVVRGNYGIAAALSTILTALTVVSLLIFNKVNGGKDLSL